MSLIKIDIKGFLNVLNDTPSQIALEPLIACHDEI